LVFYLSYFCIFYHNFFSFDLWAANRLKSSDRPDNALENILFRRISMKKTFSIILVIFTLFASQVQAGNKIKSSKGQTVYVPAYSHIYIGNKGTPYLLTITLSIRNIDLTRSITITEVGYYETQGKFLKNFITEPVELTPLASTRYIINQNDKIGGSGANFIVKWKSKETSNPPIIEAVMIGTQSQQGISFTSRGEPILESD